MALGGLTDRPWRAAAASSRMACMSLWFPVAAHPAGAASEPWYRMENSMLFPAVGHPTGPSDQAFFRVDGAHVFRYDDHPKAAPVYFVRGSMVYRFGVDGEPPWYQIR